MQCPNCNQETNKQIYEKTEENGVIKTFVHCPLCPGQEVPQLNFPAIVTKKRGRPPRPLTNAGNAMYNGQVRNPKLLDTSAKRQRDDIKNMNSRRSVIVMGDIDKSKKQAYIDKKFRGEFGGAPYKVVQSDGAMITAERVN